MNSAYEIGPLPAIKIPRVTEHVADNGLSVVAMRYPAVPRFELRMRLPGGTSWDARQGNRARIAARAAMTGTAGHSEFELARELQNLGCTMSVSAGLDYISIAGGGLSANLDRYLELLANVLTEATFASSEIDVVKAQVAQSLSIRRSDPATIARDALGGKLYGKHPYGRRTPAPTSVARVGRTAVADYFFGHARPSRSNLVLVGDISPARAVRAVDSHLARWRGKARSKAPAPARISQAHGTYLVDRPGAVQTNIRMGGIATPRGQPGFFDLMLANTIFGGYFSSRLVEKIREERGYSYSPRSGLEHHRGTSVITVGADVATEVTAAAVVEIEYELARMATAPVKESELEAARTYVAGITALSVQTQAGIAGYLSTLYAAGLDSNYLKNLHKNLATVDIDSVRAAALKYLAPGKLITVLVGDAAEVADDVTAIRPATELQKAETRPQGG